MVIEGVLAWLSQEPRVLIHHTGDELDIDRALADVLIMDLNLNGRLAVDDIPAIADAGQRIVVFSQFTEQDLVLSAQDAGASAFVAKNEGRAHLLHAVVAAATDRPYVTPTTAGSLVGNNGIDAPRLSEQERTALLWWFQSMSKTSVARRMGISPHTVDMYIRRARIKYADVGRPCPTKADMLMRAVEDGLIRPGDVTELHFRARS
nr:LuxR C-terminal-related transcriptional regulator [Cryptosporangium aurantiacum]